MKVLVGTLKLREGSLPALVSSLYLLCRLWPRQQQGRAWLCVQQEEGVAPAAPGGSAATASCSDWASCPAEGGLVMIVMMIVVMILMRSVMM